MPPRKILDIEGMDRHRHFMENTCPASRHAQTIAEALFEQRKYPMLEEEPEHCAVTIASVVSSLYQARTFLKSLGYDWKVLDNGDVEWYISIEEHDSQRITSSIGDNL